MELRTLFHVVASRWWLVLPIFVLTVAATIGFTMVQQPLYSASVHLDCSAVGHPRERRAVGAAIISRQSEIGDTYAQIGSSRDRAGAAAASHRAQRRGQRADLELDSVLLTGTTILQITATSPDPQIAADYANAVAESLVDYVEAQIRHLHSSTSSIRPAFPRRPVSPDVPLNLALGIVGGMLLGVGLALVAHLVQPQARAGLRDIVDPETWAFNDTFFAYRLSQEMNRSTRSRQSTSVALIDVNHENALDDLMPRTRTEALRRIATLLDSHVRPEDIVARLYGSVFGIVMPDTNEAQAVAIVEGLRGRLAAPAFGTNANGVPAHANPAAGVVEYREGTADVMQQAQSALRAAKEGPIGRTEAFSALSVQPGT